MAYTVQGGDTLSAIAAKNKTTVAELQRLNPQYSSLATNPDYIQKNWSLNLPGIDSAKPLSSSDLGNASNQDINIGGAPPIDTNIGDIQAQIAGMLNTVAEIQKGVDTLKDTPLDKKIDDKVDVDAGKEGVFQKMLDTIQGRKDEVTEQKSSEELADEALDKALARYGLTAESYKEVTNLTGQLTSYSQQLADLGVKKQAALDNIANKSVDARYISQEQAVVAKRYNREIAAVAAQAGVVTQTIQLKQGLLEQAEASAEATIGYMLQDKKQKLADLDWTLSTYADLYSIMNTEEKNTWTQARTEAQDDLKLESDKLNFIKDLMFKNPDAGITYNDTRESALSKFTRAGGTTNQEYAPGSIEKEWEFLGGESGTGLTKDEFSAMRKGLQFGTEEIQKWYNPDTGEIFFGDTPPPGNWTNYGSKTKRKLEPTQKPLTKAELESIGWKWLASEEASKLTNEEKIGYIQSRLGLDPYIFDL